MTISLTKGGGIFLTERESFDDCTKSDSAVNGEQHGNADNRPSQIDLYSGDDNDK